MSIHTTLSLCHTFLLSLTQSMLGGMVSRATKRHLSLTTVQNAEMEDISLHLRCGDIGAYSSTTGRTKQPWPLWQRRNTQSLMWGGRKTQLNKNDSRAAYIWMKQQLKWELTLATSNCSSMNFVGFVLQLVRILQSLVWQRTYWELKQLSGYLFSVINELSSFTLIVWIKISHTHTLSKDPHTLS